MTLVLEFSSYQIRHQVPAGIYCVQYNNVNVYTFACSVGDPAGGRVQPRVLVWRPRTDPGCSPQVRPDCPLRDVTQGCSLKSTVSVDIMYGTGTGIDIELCGGRR